LTYYAKNEAKSNTYIAWS